MSKRRLRLLLGLQDPVHLVLIELGLPLFMEQHEVQFLFGGEGLAAVCVKHGANIHNPTEPEKFSCGQSEIVRFAA